MVFLTSTTYTNRTYKSMDYLLMLIAIEAVIK